MVFQREVVFQWKKVTLYRLPRNNIVQCISDWWEEHHPHGELLAEIVQYMVREWLIS